MSKCRRVRPEATAVLATLLLMSMPVPVLAQASMPPPSAGGFANPDDPSVILANNLKILAQNPYNVDALLAAGTGSMAAGDPNAAIGFLARAEELSPRNGRVKAALGAALTQIERPVEALRIFSDAAALGIPEIELAGDRGLAWDLRGDQVRAQKDYALALKRGRNDEVARRFALSLGISGERDDAMKLIDPLTKRGDQAAWRAKAFILAMNGDMGGADRILSAVMPANMISVMSPFMRRLPGLTQAQRAQAVNFGTMPSSGTSVAVVDPGDSFRSISAGANLGPATPNTAAPVQVTRVDLARPFESSKDRRRREKEQRALAKLAEEGKQRQAAVVRRSASNAPLPRSSAAPMKVAVQTRTTPVLRPTTAPRLPSIDRSVAATTPSVSQRVGPRISNIDPARLPPELRADPVAGTPGRLAETKVSVLDGVRTLPPPDGVAARANVAQSASMPAGTPATMPATMPAPKTVLAPLSPPISAAAFPETPKPEPVKVAAITPSPVTATPTVNVPQSAVITPPPLPDPAPGFSLSVTPATTPAPVTTPAPTLAPTPVDPAAVPVPSTATLINPSNTAGSSALQPVFSPEPTVPANSDIINPVVDSPPVTAELPATDAPAVTGLAAVVEGLEVEDQSAAGPIPTEVEFRARQLAAKRKADAATKLAADEKAKLKLETDIKAKKDAEAKAKAAIVLEKEKEVAALAKSNPARIWVQLATGANKSGLPVTWRKLKVDAPKSLVGQTAWYVPFRATNRLLIGPFKSSGEARVVVGKLSKEGVSANSFTSEVGVNIIRLGGK